MVDLETIRRVEDCLIPLFSLILKVLPIRPKPMTNKDIKKLIDAMKEDFPTLEIYAHLEQKIDEIAERVNENGERLSHLMTKEEAISLFDMATMKTEHDHMKKFLREKFNLVV